MSRARLTDEDARFIEKYRPDAYPRPAVTVDIAVFTVIDARLVTLLIKRNEAPFRNQWALPGGFVRVGTSRKDQGESVDDAAARELREETGLPLDPTYLEQVAAFGKPMRDPRMRVISVAYFALIRPALGSLIHAGTDASHAQWVHVSDLKKRALAFDHESILSACLTRLRERVDNSNAAFALVGETFTIPELRAVHEVVHSQALDAGNFRRRFMRWREDGIIEEAPGKRITASKPATVYRFSQSR